MNHVTGKYFEERNEAKPNPLVYDELFREKLSAVTIKMLEKIIDED